MWVGTRNKRLVASCQARVRVAFYKPSIATSVKKTPKYKLSTSSPPTVDCIPSCFSLAPENTAVCALLSIRSKVLSRPHHDQDTHSPQQTTSALSSPREPPPFAVVASIETREAEDDLHIHTETLHLLDTERGPPPPFASLPTQGSHPPAPYTSLPSSSSAPPGVPFGETKDAKLPLDQAPSYSKKADSEPPPPYTEGSSPIPSFVFSMAPGGGGGAASVITQVQQGGGLLAPGELAFESETLTLDLRLANLDTVVIVAYADAEDSGTRFTLAREELLTLPEFVLLSLFPNGLFPDAGPMMSGQEGQGDVYNVDVSFLKQFYEYSN